MNRGESARRRAPSGRVTAADIARAAGVSRATVGFVLNDTPGQTISADTRARVREAAERLGYRPNRAAAALAGGRSGIILLVLPDWPVGYTMRRCLEEASRVLDDAGRVLVTQTPTAAARPLWESLDPEVVVGWGPFAEADIASMRAAGVTRILPDPDTPIAPVETDAGARLQIAHLWELGHRAIGYATAPDPRIRDLVRVRAAAAAREAAAASGAEPLDVRTADPADGSAERAVRAWHAGGVTAVAAYNDDVAAAVVGAAVRAGIRVPEDLAVIGHDDSPLASLLLPSLSSVRMDSAEAGRRLATTALRLATGPVGGVGKRMAEDATEGGPPPSAGFTPDTRVVARESTAGRSAGREAGA